MRPTTVPIVAVEQHYFAMCAPSDSYHHVFSTLSHKRQIIAKKILEHKMCVIIFYTRLSEPFRILRGTNGDIIEVHRSLCDVPVILVRF
jgi:hypothetical protein